MSRLSVKLLAAVLVAFLAVGCKRTPAAPTAPPKTPTVRLYLLSTLAGAMEPCGCHKDMLGGVDHAAALIAAERSQVPHQLVFGAGPMLFMNPTLEGASKTQDLWKAGAIASALADIGLKAWAPGANDWAAGGEQLARLAKQSGAHLVGGNLIGVAGPIVSHHVYAAGDVKIGVAGVTEPKSAVGLPEGLEVGEASTALREAQTQFSAKGANVRVALVAMDRGAALRLVEQVEGFDVVVVGKASDRGEGNDAPTPPVLVGETLVVQAPNHLQAVAVVDLFVRGGYDFKDGSGVQHAEKRHSLERRIAELQARIADWEQNKKVADRDLKARRADLDALRREHAELDAPKPPSQGSFFSYELRNIAEALGSDRVVARRMDEYYRKVNRHNKEAFKDRKPKPALEGQSHYLGGEDCSNCHEAAFEFWKKTPHASAYSTLVDQHKEFNLDCVGCHVTGYDEPGGSTVTHVDGLRNVQCEACHGPGSRHEDEPEDETLLIKAPPRDLCQRCHHPPHVADDWSVDQAWPHIVGPGHGGK